MLLCHFGLPATTSSFEMETFPAVIVKNAQLTLRSRLSSTNKSDFTVTGNVAFLTLEPWNHRYNFRGMSLQVVLTASLLLRILTTHIAF